MTLSIQNRNNSYFDLQNKVSDCQKLLNLLKYYPNGISDADMAFYLKMPKSIVSARRNDNGSFIVECGTVKDANSKKSVTLWKYNPSGEIKPKVSKSKQLQLIKEYCNQNPCVLADLINSMLV